MKQVLTFLLFIVLSGFPSAISAQENRGLFENGKKQFKQENYVSARHLLGEYLLFHSVKPYYREEAEYMLACSAYELKEPGCVELMKDYVRNYPESPHLNRMYVLIASSYFFQKEYDEAISLFEKSELTLLSDPERDAATFRFALCCLETGNLTEASVWFLTLKDSSRLYRTDAVYYLSYIDYLQGRYDASLSGFLSLQDEKKYAEVAPYYIAEIYLLKKNFDKSQIVAQNYLSTYSQNKYSLKMKRILGESEYEMGQYAKAIETLSNYTDLTADPERRVLYQLGMSFFNTRVFSRAATELEKVTFEKDALSQNAYFHIGLAYLQLKDNSKARIAFSRAASFDFDLKVKEQALYNYALCLHQTTYAPFDESVKVFERFLNEFPDSQYSENVNEYLVEVYLNTRSYEAALNSMAKILHPGSRILEAKQKILFRLGTQSFVNGRFQEAIDYFNRSLELSHYDLHTKANTYYWLGEACYRLKRYSQARQDFQFYLENTQDKKDEIYPMAFYGLGYTAFQQKDYGASLNWFLKYMQLNQQGDRKILSDVCNRVGDCYFYLRKFSDAYSNYMRAVDINPSLGDYSLFQAAFVLGLQKNYAGKVQLLNKLLSQYPESTYVENALYEKGRAYVQMEDTPRAIETFRKLLADFPKSPFARKGANEIGLLYYQSDNFSKAIDAYEKVIISYPGSEEALLAQRDLRSIFIELNKIDEYADFLSKVPGHFSFDSSERDSLTYLAAEKIYMKGDVSGAKKSFEKYLDLFPLGAYSLNAHYYTGVIDYSGNNNEDALGHFKKVLEFPDNRFSEDAITKAARIYYDSKDYPQALVYYKLLREKALTAEKRQLAKVGILRCTKKLEKPQEIILAASDLLEDSKLTPELESEAKLDRAKSYLNQNTPKAALTDLKDLSEDTRTIYGAEAKYLLAQLYFDIGETALAEKEILDYIDKSTPHAYWLARSFILLSDLYLKMGKKTDARHYLISLQENYQAKDDISGMVESRLKKLNK